MALPIIRSVRKQKMSLMPYSGARIKLKLTKNEYVHGIVKIIPDKAMVSFLPWEIGIPLTSKLSDNKGPRSKNEQTLRPISGGRIQGRNQTKILTEAISAKNDASFIFSCIASLLQERSNARTSIQNLFLPWPWD